MASARARSSAAGGAATPPTRVVDVRPVPRHVREGRRTSSAPCDRPGCDGTWTWTVGAAAGGVRGQAASRPAGLCADDEAKLAALEDKPVPCAVPGCTRTSVFSRRAQLMAGAPDVEPPAADAALRAVRGRVPQAQGSPGPLRHQRLRPQVDLDGRRADRGLRQRPAQRSAAPDVRQVQGRLRRDRRPRGPLPDVGLQEDLDLDPQRSAGRLPRRASQRPRRRTGCARAARRSTGTCRTSNGPAAVPAARAPGSTSAAASWRARCAARPAIPIRSTARVREGDRSISRIGRSRARPTTAPGTWTWTKAAQLAAGVRPELKEPKVSQAEAPGDGRRRSPWSRRRRPRSRRRRRSPRGVLAEAAAARKQGEEASATARDPAARAPLPGLQRLPQGQEDAGDPVQAVRDADLLAAREPAADPPRRLGRAGACAARASATRSRRRAQRRARGAPPRDVPGPGETPAARRSRRSRLRIRRRPPTTSANAERAA